MTGEAWDHLDAGVRHMAGEREVLWEMFGPFHGLEKLVRRHHALVATATALKNASSACGNDVIAQPYHCRGHPGKAPTK